MQAAEPEKRPLKLQDALFWEDAFCVRKKASFRTAVFQKAHSGPIGLKDRQVLGPGYVTLSPDKSLDGSPTLAASSLGAHPPYGAIALRDLSELCAGRQGQVQLTPKLVNRSFVFVDQPVAPNAGIGQYELFKGVADQVKMQNELGLHIHTLALPGKQAVVQLPASIWRVMVLCERKPPEAFSQELTKFTGKSTSAP